MKKLLSLFAITAMLFAALATAQNIQVYSGADMTGPCNPFPQSNPNPVERYNSSTGNYFICSITVSGATPYVPLWTSTGAPTGSTGSGLAVLQTSPTLITPALGVATGTSLALGGGTALASTNQTGTGSLVLSTSPTLVTPALGTPASGVVTNLTGFPPALVHLNVQKNLLLTDLQTLNSVPYQILAPPGATSMYQMGSCTLNLTRGSAAFTGGGTVSIGYDTTSSPATNGTIASTVFTTFAASHAVVVLPVAVAVTATTGLANKGIYITAASGDFASGTGATGQLNCDYSIVTGVQ